MALDIRYLIRISVQRREKSIAKEFPAFSRYCINKYLKRKEVARRVARRAYLVVEVARALLYREIAQTVHTLDGGTADGHRQDVTGRYRCAVHTNVGEINRVMHENRGPYGRSHGALVIMAVDVQDDREPDIATASWCILREKKKKKNSGVFARDARFHKNICPSDFSKIDAQGLEHYQNSVHTRQIVGGSVKIGEIVARRDIIVVPVEVLKQRRYIYNDIMMIIIRRRGAIPACA